MKRRDRSTDIERPDPSDPFLVRVPNPLGRIAESQELIERHALMLEHAIRAYREEQRKQEG